jgi:hypothetical protein
MQQDEHNKLALEWKLNVCIEHKCDIIGMSSTAIRQSQSDYHPKERDNVKVDLFPVEINFRN